jgi:hypothetical protein
VYVGLFVEGLLDHGHAVMDGAWHDSQDTLDFMSASKEIRDE